MGPRASLWVMLNGEQCVLFVLEAFDGVVIQIDIAHGRPWLERVCVHGKPMILAGNLYAT